MASDRADRRARPGNRRVLRFPPLASWAAVAIVLFNTVATLLLPAHPAGAASLDGLDGRIVICTAGGLVVLNADGTPATDHAEACVNCLPLLDKGQSAAWGPAEPALTLGRVEPVFVVVERHFDRQAVWRPVARAPPPV